MHNFVREVLDFAAQELITWQENHIQLCFYHWGTRIHEVEQLQRNTKCSSLEWNQHIPFYTYYLYAYSSPSCWRFSVCKHVVSNYILLAPLCLNFNNPFNFVFMVILFSVYTGWAPTAQKSSNCKAQTLTDTTFLPIVNNFKLYCKTCCVYDNICSLKYSGLVIACSNYSTILRFFLINVSIKIIYDSFTTTYPIWSAMDPKLHMWPSQRQPTVYE